MAINFLNTVDFNKNQLDYAAIQNIGSNPTGTAVEGQIYFNTQVFALMIYANGSWVEVGATSGVETFTTTQTGNSTGNSLTVLTNETGPVTVNSFAYAGGSNVGYVPAGGAAGKYLDGAGSWLDVTTGDIESVNPSTVNNRIGIAITNPLGPDPTVGLDIVGTTPLGATPATDDKLLIYDDSATTNKSITVGNLVGGFETTYELFGVGSTNGTAGIQLDGSDGTLDNVLIIGDGTTSVTRSANTLTVTSNDQWDGTVKSVNFKTDGTALNVNSNDVTVTGTMTGIWQGTAAQYVNGEGDLTTFPAIPQGDITQVDITAGDGLSGTSVDTTTGAHIQTLTVGQGDGITVSATNVGVNSTVVRTTGAQSIAGLKTFTDQVTIPQTPGGDDKAASKYYVDQSNLGQSVFQGGYNAATNTPNLDVSPSNAIKKGWFWAVTDTGDFFAEEVQPGDLIYANQDNPGATFANWTVVQSGQDIATAGASDGATVKGIAGFNSAHFNVTANGWVSSDIYGGGSTLGIVPSGGGGTTFLRGDGTWVTPTDSVTSVEASTVSSLLGISVTPTAGDVKVGLNINGLTPISTLNDADTLAIYDGGINKKISLLQLENHIVTSNSRRFILNTTTTNVSQQVSPPSGTIGWVVAVGAALGVSTALDCAVEVIETATGATVYAEVTRSGTNVTINFSTPVSQGAYQALITRIY
jgi:hypothetical protein